MIQVSLLASRRIISSDSTDFIIISARCETSDISRSRAGAWIADGTDECSNRLTGIAL